MEAYDNTNQIPIYIFIALCYLKMHLCHFKDCLTGRIKLTQKIIILSLNQATCTLSLLTKGSKGDFSHQKYHGQ